MRRRTHLVAGSAATIAAMLVWTAPPVAAQTAPRAAPTRAAVLRDLAGLVRSTNRVPLRRAQRRRAVADARAARRAFTRRRACPANTRLLRLHKRLAPGRARGARARGLRQARVRVSRVRARLLRTLPDRRGCGGAATFDVDATVRPAAASLPGLVRGPRRPVARVVDANGEGADFVANELWISTANEAEVRALVRRWRGTVLKTVDPGVPGVPRQYLLRIDASRADQEGLAADVGALVRTRGTANRVSSEQGLDLLAAVADSARSVRGIGVNWIGRGADIASGSSFESATGPSDFSTTGPVYSTNAFDWTHFAAGAVQGMGVPQAWQLLANGERLQRNSVRLAVLDMGFAPETNGPDFGSDVIAISNVPFTNALGTANLLGCGGGSCPWHGTNALNAAAAVADNGAGAAGPGGPVVRPVVVFTLYDFFTGIAAVTEAFASGARISNMSYGADVPAVLSWSVLPFELTTGAFRAAGMIQFAAAGNSDVDVDAEDCFIVCWEETLHTPCENIGVTCVGALGHNTLEKASYSNRGNSGVDIWAPGRVLVGSTPQQSGVHAVQGTSFASPYAAGVAALLNAADPGLGANEIETILFRTARTGPGAVRRVISPLAAVRDALPPFVRIGQPADGASFRRGSTVNFEAFAFDDGRGVEAVSWTLDGAPLASDPAFSRNDLPYGTHDVVVALRVGGGTTVTDSARITITNDPPTVDITSPDNGATVFQGQTVTFRGSSIDVNQPESGFRLTDAQVSWFLDDAPTPWGTGHNASRDFSGVSPGTHTIRFRGSDGQAPPIEDTITITVQANPANIPPSVTIDSPANDTNFVVEPSPDGTGKYYKDVTFASSADDPESGPLTYQWTDSVNDGPPTVRSANADPTLRLYYEGDCPSTKHELTVRVTDDAMNTATDTVRVFVSSIC